MSYSPGWPWYPSVAEDDPSAGAFRLVPPGARLPPDRALRIPLPCFPYLFPSPSFSDADRICTVGLANSAHWPDATRSCQSDVDGTVTAPSGVICRCFHTSMAGLRSSDRDHVATECVPCVTLSRKACWLAPGAGAHGSAACTFSSALAPVLVITLLMTNGPEYSTGWMPLFSFGVLFLLECSIAPWLFPLSQTVIWRVYYLTNT